MANYCRMINASLSFSNWHKNTRWLMKFFLLLVTSFAGCQKIESISNIPQISFLRSETSLSTDALDSKNKRVIVHFTLADGDGNFGLTEADSLPPFSVNKNNCYVKVQFKQNKKWIAKDSTIGYRIPYIGSSNGQAIVLRAETRITFDYPEANYPFDSVRYEIWVEDRDFNMSNRITTPAIGLPR